jgi:hypothetical protein
MADNLKPSSSPWSCPPGQDTFPNNWIQLTQKSLSCFLWDILRLGYLEHLGSNRENRRSGDSVSLGGYLAQEHEWRNQQKDLPNPICDAAIENLITAALSKSTSVPIRTRLWSSRRVKSRPAVVLVKLASCLGSDNLDWAEDS